MVPALAFLLGLPLANLPLHAQMSAPIPGFYAMAYAPAPVHPSTPSQGYLGVDIHDVTEEQASALKLRQPHGAEIVQVDHDGPAGKAGLRRHDIILQMNGQPIEGEEQLRRILHEIPAGRQVTLLISREGHEQTVSTTMANREVLEREAWEQHITVPAPPAFASNPSLDSSHSSGFLSHSAAAAAASMNKAHNLLGTMVLSSSYTGAMLEVMGPQLAQFFGTQGGLLVRSIDENSPAAAAGMLAGDIVIRANAVPIATPGDWAKVIHAQKGKPVAVVVLRDKREQTLTLVPDAKRRSSVRLPEADGIEQAMGMRLRMAWMQ